MKNKIVTKHEVRLNNQWFEVQPMFEKDNGIYFIDPRPKSSADLKQPPNQGILNGVRKVELLFVSFTSSGYRAEHYAHAYVNSETGEVEEYLEDRAEFPSPVKSGLKLAKIIFK